MWIDNCCQARHSVEDVFPTVRGGTSHYGGGNKSLVVFPKENIVTTTTIGQVC